MAKNVCLNCGYFLNCNYASEHLTYCEKFVKANRTITRIENKKEVKKMKVMISQPMRGKTNEQIKQEREELVKRLENDGFEVIDTIISEEPPQNSDAAIYYLSKSIEFISKVDIVYFMKGWETARGCKIENRICQDYGKQTMYEIYEK